MNKLIASVFILLVLYPQNLIISKPFIERTEELKYPTVTPIDDNWENAFRKRYNELVPSNVQGLFDQRPGFENDSTSKTVIRNLIQIPKGIYLRFIPIIQFWAEAENRQAIEESLDAVNFSKHQGLINQEKADELSEKIIKSFEYVAPNRKEIQKKIECKTNIPIESSCRIGDLLGLGGFIGGFSTGSVLQISIRALAGSIISRLFENIGIPPNISDFVGILLSQTSLVRNNGLFCRQFRRNDTIYL